MRRLLLVLLAVAAVAVPAARAQAVSPGEACAAALEGSAVDVAIGRAGTPFVCEDRPPGAPPVAGGDWDGTTIRLWPVGLDPRLVRKLAAHELGHAEETYRPDLAAAWYAMRGTSGQTALEDFAESFYRALYPEPGMSFVQYGSSYATPDQLAVMASWFPPPSGPPPTFVAPRRPPAAAAPLPAPDAPAALPGPPPPAAALLPSTAPTPAPPALPAPIAPTRPQARITAILAALRVAGV